MQSERLNVSRLKTRVEVRPDYRHKYIVRSESRCALRLRYIGYFIDVWYMLDEQILYLYICVIHTVVLLQNFIKCIPSNTTR
jgi:hypothetical protein